MSDIKESIDWFEEHFKNVQPIGNGSFGNVMRANWKSNDRLFALKFFKNDKITIREVINEVS
ncbi:4054_t:CDS:1, partial [Funneliformis caledonium]